MNEPLITLDIDWAPDFVIDFVAEQLIKHQVCATWFVTHASPAIERLRQYPNLFELGIHPNFLAGSTHGTTPNEILSHCMNLVPEATSVRTHGLVQSTPLLSRIMARTPVTTDVSLFLPHTPGLQPTEYIWQRRTLLRIPYFWEDDFEMERSKPIWDLAPLLALGEGLKIFDFHPIHVYLNSLDMGPYTVLKQQVRKLSEATRVDVDPFVHVGIGTQTLFMELVQHLSVSGWSLLIKDLARDWKVSRTGETE